jgi:hypothetical protein
MLRPTKHSHPDKTVVSCATLILSRVKANRICEYSDLVKFIEKKKIGSRSLFMPALNLLFLLGLVVYHQKNDSIEFADRS